jgi:hypothetical protein
MEYNYTIIQISVEALGLSDVAIVKTRADNDGSFIITVKSTKEKTLYRKCGKPTELYGKGQVTFLLS